MSGFIAMVSVLTVVAIEMFFATKGAAHSHGEVDLEYLQESQGGSWERRGEAEGQRRSGSFKPFRQIPIGAGRESEDAAPLRSSPYSDTPGSVDKPLPPPPPGADDLETSDHDSDLDLDELEDPDLADDDNDNTQLLNGSPSNTRQHPSNGNLRPKAPRNVSFADPLTSPIPPTATLQTANHDQRLILQCLLLEAGILFHSIFIGMALSVSTGPAFIVLLIAISFHQTFEGLALGSRIAAIPSFSTTSFKPWLMGVLYGVTTPIGQAIGLAVHTLYDPESRFGLLMVGIVNAVSAGLLLYAGLVQLLAEDFLSDQSYVDLRGRRRVEACGAVVCGSLLMAFVGAFA